MQHVQQPGHDPTVPVVTTAPARTLADRTRVPVIEVRIMLWLFVVMSASFLLIQEGTVNNYDGRTMFEVTKSIVDTGSFSISDEWNTLPGRGGLHYGRYGLGLSLVSVVPYVFVRPLAGLSGHSEFVSSAAVAAIIPLTAASLVVALYALARRLRAGIGAALMAASGAVVGTFMLPYTKEFFSEPLTALCLVVAIERLLARRPATAGLAMGIAVLTRPQILLFAPVFLFVSWRRNGTPALLRAIAGLAPGVAATLGYNIARFGDPLLFGYQDVGFTTPFLTGVRGLLFEPTKSILLFAPVILVLPFALRKLWRQERAAFVLITVNLAITCILTATWFAWHGGWSWGPRLLLPGLIPAFAAIGPWLSTPARIRITGLLLALGFLVSLPAVIVSPGAQLLEVSPPPPETHYLDTQPLHSPSVARQIEMIPAALRYSIEHPYQAPEDGLNHLRSLSLWQLGTMRVLGRQGLVLSVTGSLLLLTVIVVGGSRLRGTLHDVAVEGSRNRVAGRATGGGAEGGYQGVLNLQAMEAAHNYNQFLDSTVLSRMDPLRPVLDFGAGTGTHARRLRAKGLDVRCVEPDPQLRHVLEQQGFEVGDSALEFGREVFASIYSLNVLEHIDDDNSALRELFAATEPGGRLILYVPAFPILFSAMDRELAHVRRYRRRLLCERVQDAGFQIVRSRYVDSLGFIAALIYRLVARNGKLSSRTVALYDRFVFPVSRALDSIVDRWIGKNVLVEARRD